MQNYKSNTKIGTEKFYHNRFCTCNKVGDIFTFTWWDQEEDIYHKDQEEKIYHRDQEEKIYHRDQEEQEGIQRQE